MIRISWALSWCAALLAAPVAAQAPPAPLPGEQCLEYIQRVRPDLGIPPGQGTAANFVANVDDGRIPRLQLFRHGAGDTFRHQSAGATQSTKARPGDVLAFGTGAGIGPAGHVAIVTAVQDVNISVVQANFPSSAADGSYTFVLNGPRGSDRQILGIIRPVKVGQAGKPSDALPSHEMTNSIRFALQCNATLGTIENVDILKTAPVGDGTVSVSGTYRQRVGNFSRFGVQGPDSMGGVFEGLYHPQRRSLTFLQFKVSIRTGTVPQGCLR
jgi:hypothetical protein